MNSKLWWLWLLVILAVVNYFASDFHLKLDLTKEKRYTLSKATKDLLATVDDDVQIDVFLKGEFPAGFKKLANSTTEFLRLLQDRSSKIHYRFISPLESIPQGRGTYGDSLVAMGAVPINLTVRKEAGQSSNIIFPTALISYKGKTSLVSLYPGASNRISQEEINSAEALMEYQFINVLDKMMRIKKAGVAYSIGNGEPVDGRTFDLRQTISQDYQFGTINLNTLPLVPDEVDVLLIVKPSVGFSDQEKFKIDQFVMRGGKLLCFIDNLYAEQDSLNIKPELVAFDRNLNLTDLFFRYGVRINTDLVMDLQSDVIPFVVGGTDDNPQYEFLNWNYFPLFTPSKQPSFIKNIGYVGSKFANSMDTIKTAGIRKTPLLVSSSSSRIISTPAIISLNENKFVPEDARYKLNAVPVAYLLQGNFTSLFNNRVTTTQLADLKALGKSFISQAENGQIIIVSDGDMVLNDFIPNPGAEPTPLPMGWNKYTYGEYAKQSEYGKLFVAVANQEFLQSALEQLVNTPDIIQLRNKDIILRLLDSKKVKDGKSKWQFINIGLPVLLILLFGFIYQQIRKRKYAA